MGSYSHAIVQRYTLRKKKIRKTIGAELEKSECFFTFDVLSLAVVSPFVVTKHLKRGKHDT